MGIDRMVFLAAAMTTHGLLGYILVSALTEADPRVGAVLAVAPDVDLLFPLDWGPTFAHRSFTHAPSVTFLVVAVVYAVRRRRSDAGAVALALGSHLALDGLSPMGLPLLVRSGDLPSPGLPVHDLEVTVLLWALVAAGWLYVSSDGRPTDRVLSE